jgi:hypothetical protein
MNRMLRYLVALLPIVLTGADVVSFPSGTHTLKGVMFKPEGSGPFPAVVYNHGNGQDFSKPLRLLVPFSPDAAGSFSHHIGADRA